MPYAIDFRRRLLRHLPDCLHSSVLRYAYVTFFRFLLLPLTLPPASLSLLRFHAAFAAAA